MKAEEVLDEAFDRLLVDPPHDDAGRFLIDALLACHPDSPKVSIDRETREVEGLVEPPPFGSVPFGTMFVPGGVWLHGDNEWHEFPGPLELPPRQAASDEELFVATESMDVLRGMADGRIDTFEAGIFRRAADAIEALLHRLSSPCPEQDEARDAKDERS